MKANLCFNKLSRNRRDFKRGGALLGTLVFTAIISSLLAAAGLITLSHYKYTRTETDYAHSLNLAEAGINFEIRKISQNAASADQKGNTNGVSYTLGRGQYTVYCANTDGTTPWSGSGNVFIYSSGTVNGVTRTVRVTGKQITSSGGGSYAMFGVDDLTMHGNHNIVGDLGTNGSMLLTGPVTATGSAYINGPGASLTEHGPVTAPEIDVSQPVAWQTVDQIINSKISGGWNTLQTINDNSLGYSSSGTYVYGSKLGGANYYLTALQLSGNADITFDNSLGPITLWVGPSGANGGVSVAGGHALIAADSDPTKAVTIYVATTGGATFHGNKQCDFSLYDYNGPSSDGTLTITGTGAFYGSLVARSITNNGNVDINYRDGSHFTGSNYYGYADQWVEIPNY